MNTLDLICRELGLSPDTALDRVLGVIKALRDVGRANGDLRLLLHDTQAALKRYMAGHPCIGHGPCPSWTEAQVALDKVKARGGEPWRWIGEPGVE